MSEVAERAPRARPRGRGGLVMLFSVAFIVATGVLGWISLAGGRIAAPDWVREMIVARAAELVPDARFDMSDLGVSVRNGRPLIRLEGIAITDGNGASLLRLAEADVELSARKLLSGEFQARRISLNSAQITLNRGFDGQFGIAVGGASTPLRQADTLQSLLESFDAALLDPRFSALREISAENLTLRYDDAVMRRGWTVDGGRMRVARDGDRLELSGNFALLGARSYATTLAVSYSSPIGGLDADFGMQIEDLSADEIASLIPALSFLKVIDAPLSGSVRATLDGMGELGGLVAALEIGGGALRPTRDVRPIRFEAAKTYLSYDPGTQRIAFDEISVESDWVTATASGQSYLRDFNAAWPETLLSQLIFSSLRVNPNAVYPAPLEFDAGAMDVRLRLDPFTLDVGQATLTRNGRVLDLRGQVEAAEDGWAMALDLTTPEISRDRLMALWPPEWKPKTRLWFDENLTAGIARDVNATLRAAPGARADLTVGFEFSEAATRFLKRMPPIAEASGYGLLRDNRLTLALDGGHVTAPQGGRVEVAGSTLEIADLRVRGGDLLVNLRTDSTVTAALSLLDQPPLELLSKAGRPVTLADGRASLAGRLTVPLRPGITGADVGYRFDGQIADVRSEALVPGRVLAAQALDLAVDNEGIEIAGAARLGRVPLEGVWAMGFTPQTRGRSTVTAEVELSERFIDEFGIGLPPGAVSGQGTGSISIQLERDRAPVFALVSNLEGVALRLDAVNWTKPAARGGTLEVAGTLGPVPDIERLSLTAPGLTAVGSVGLTQEGRMEAARFSSVSIGDWFDGPVTLRGRGPGVAPAVEIAGGTLDIRRLPKGRATGEGGPIDARLDRVTITETVALTGLTARLTPQGGLKGPFTARVNEGPVIEGLLSPAADGTAISLRSEEGARVFRAAGLIGQSRGGAMEMRLTPRGNGIYDGQMRMRDLQVNDAPTLAELLSTLSVVGLLDQLTGQGLVFTEVDADFRFSPERLIITESSAIGPSMGISLDGVIDLAARQLDLQGVISPIYLINGIGSIFTRKGEGLIGFNFRLTGASKEPRVQVNPLSVLTPGMFREIFRRPVPQLNQ